MTRAIIIGAGVAGPATAMALQRVGIEAVVHEAYDRSADEVGSILTVAVNGLDALRALGLHDRVAAAGFPTPSNVLLSHRGKRLGVVTNGGRRTDGTVGHTIQRSRLYAVLRDAALERGIRFAYGKRLVDARTTPDGGVVAQFADGSQTSGDLLIGADGIHSTVRTIIDRDAPPPRYAGLLNFGGYTPGPPPAGAEPGTWYMIFGTQAFFGYVAAPAGGTFWFVNLPRTATTAEERAATTDATWTRLLLDAVAADHGPATDLIAAGTLQLSGANTHDLPKIPHWRRGPMVVVGDAAHAPTPSSGQGASIAAEDAIVLAQSLRDVPAVPDALATFERRRRQRVERIVAHGARTSSSKTPGPIGRGLRDLALPLVFKLVVTDRSLAWVHDHHLELETAPDGPERRDGANTR